MRRLAVSHIAFQKNNGNKTGSHLLKLNISFLLNQDNFYKTFFNQEILLCKLQLCMNIDF